MFFTQEWCSGALLAPHLLVVRAATKSAGTPRVVSNKVRSPRYTWRNGVVTSLANKATFMPEISAVSGTKGITSSHSKGCCPSSHPFCRLGCNSEVNVSRGLSQVIKINLHFFHNWELLTLDKI